MELRDYLINGQFTWVGLTGGAGSGKSTLAKGLNFCTYHLDDFFIGDSAYRTELLTKKVRNVSSYIDACNQYNWWDWEEAESRIFSDTGVKFPAIVEGALLGTEYMLSKYDIILYLSVSPEVRFNRLLERDKYKRDFHDALDRFLITEYSETIYYRQMLQKFSGKIVVLDEDFKMMKFLPYFPEKLSIPVRLELP